MRGTRDVAIAFRRPCLLFWLTLVILALSTAFYDFHFDRIEARLDRIDRLQDRIEQSLDRTEQSLERIERGVPALARPSRGTPS